MKIRIALITLSLIGTLNAIYLLLIRVLNNPLMCPQNIGDCWAVNTSRFSSILGIPVSVYGILGYVVIFILVVMEKKSTFFQELSLFGVFGMALFGSLFSIYLTYLEIAVIKAICPLCFFSALLMFTIFGFSMYKLVKSFASQKD